VIKVQKQVTTVTMQINAKTVQLLLVQSHRHTKVFTFSAAKDDRLLLTIYPAELKSLHMAPMLLTHRTEFWPTRLALESDATLIKILTIKII